MGDLRHAATSVLLLAVAILLIAPSLPILGLPSPELTTNVVFSGPSEEHLLGTDQFGRDNLSRTLWAFRDAVIVTLLATLTTAILGLALGMLSLLGSWIDRAILIVINVSLAIPGLILALVLLTFFEASLVNVAVAVGLSLMPVFARVARAALLSIRTRSFVEASLALGAGKLRITISHLLPNVSRELISFLAVIFSWSALNVAALDFLGLAGSPSTPSLGNLLVDGRTYLRATPWIALGPGLALSLLTFVAFGLSDIADSR